MRTTSINPIKPFVLAALLMTGCGEVRFSTVTPSTSTKQEEICSNDDCETPQPPVVVQPPPVVVTPPPPVVVTPPPPVVVTPPPPVIVTPPPPVVVTPPPPVIVTPPPPPTPDLVTEEFVQTQSSGKLDILFVIDNSISMNDEMWTIERKFKGILNLLSGIDYQISVVTTDVTTPANKAGFNGQADIIRGLASQILTPDMNNAEPSLLSTFYRPEVHQCLNERANPRLQCASDKSQPLRAIREALRLRHSENAGVFREDANFAAVILSDDDEKPLDRDPATRPEEVMESLAANYPGRRASVFSIVIPPGDNDCKRKQVTSKGQFGHRLAEMAEISGGKVASICENSYVEPLASLRDLGSPTSNLTEVILQNDPIENSVLVKFTPEHSTQIQVEGRKVKFVVPPPVGTFIQIQYSK